VLDNNNMPMCNCPSGFPGDQCDAGDAACSTYRCANGGICKAKEPLTGMGANDSGYDAFCACDIGYYGKHCDTKVADCSLNCQNGGQCEINFAKNEPYCECAVNFFGATCEKPRVRCGMSYCYNGGKCFFNGKSDECDCSNADFNFTKWGGPECSDVSEGGSGGLSSAGAALVAISVIIFSAFGVFVYRQRRSKARNAQPPEDLVMMHNDDGEDKEMI